MNVSESAATARATSSHPHNEAGAVAKAQEGNGDDATQREADDIGVTAAASDKKRRFILVGGIVFGLVALAIGISLRVTRNRNRKTKDQVLETLAPTSPSPTTAPTTPIIIDPVTGNRCFTSYQDLYDQVRLYYNTSLHVVEYGTSMSEWCVGLVTDMTELFGFLPQHLTVPIGNWDVSRVTSMDYMLAARHFNQDLSAWNVSSVTSMEGMFRGTNAESSFNGNISTWDVSSVTNMRAMFSSASVFNGDISQWNVSSVNSMEYMFAGATSFNGNLSI